MKQSWMVHLERVTVRIRDRLLLPDTDWVIDSDQHWAVIGPNGAGKTSLVAALAGELPVVSGKIHFNRFHLLPDQVGYVSFEHQRRLIAREELRDHARFFSRNFDFQTVRQILCRTYRPHVAGRERWRPLMDRLGLDVLLDRPVRHLSNGEIRKVLIAAEIMRSPRLLILDEPFDGLDPASCRNLQQWLEERVEKGLHLVLVTHRLSDIPAYITDILALENGRLRYQARRDEAFAIESAGDDEPQPSIETDRAAAPTGRGRQTVADGDGLLIDFKNVSVAFGQIRILHGLNWRMRVGENWSVLGPNGSGKSTLLRLITGDLPQAYASEIYLFGRRKGSGESVWEIKHRIGYVSPEFQIRYRQSIPAMAVVLSGFFDSVGLYRVPSPAQRQSAEKWMKRMGIFHLAQRKFTELSQGEQRLVLLARAMVKEPLLLILDEPCQGLDRNYRKKTLHLIDHIGRGSGTNILFVSHPHREIPACTTHVLRFIRTADGSYRYVCSPVKGSAPIDTSI